MPSNTRQKIKEKVNNSENKALGIIADSSFILNKYAPDNLTDQHVLETIQNVMMFSYQNEIDNPLQAYVIMRRNELVPDLGRYAEHLFNWGAIHVVALALIDSIQEFRKWERTFIRGV